MSNRKINFVLSYVKLSSYVHKCRIIIATIIV